MAIVASILALGLLAQSPAPAPGTYTLFKDTVAAVSPKLGVTDYPPEIKAWPGWGPLAGEFGTPFLVDGDWSSTLASASAVKPDGPATPFRIRVILIPSVDLLFKTSSGNLDERRTTMNAPIKARVEQGLALAAEALKAQTGGRVTVDYDTSVDAALYEETVASGDGLADAAVQAYVQPRINGGTFEANDKLFHGPYNLCLVIHSGLTPSVSTVECGTPVVAFSTAVADRSTSACALQILDAFRQAATYWSANQGHQAAERASSGPIHLFDPTRIARVFGDQPLDQIVADTSTAPVTGENYVKNIQAGTYPWEGYDGPSVQPRSTVSGNADLSLGTDDAKGSVLTLKLGGLFRHGGISLPAPKDFAMVLGGPNHFLVFDYQTSSHDPIGIAPFDRDFMKESGVSLGPRDDPGSFAAVPADSAWHTVAIDLSQFPRDSVGLYLGFLPSSQSNPRISIVTGSYEFANFRLAATAPAEAVPIQTSSGPSWEADATSARVAAKAVGTPEGVLAMAQWLDKTDEPIRLNALDSLSNVKSPGLEDKIASLIGNVNPRITEAAIAALAFQDTPTAWATLSKTVSLGPGTHAKAVAAMFVARRKDPASSGPISAIQGLARDWHDRIRSAEALGESNIPQAWLFLQTPLGDDDPMVRAATVNLINLADDDGMRKLMFVSVNDASDAVRAQSCIKLLQSSTPEIKREGYRGVGDDSWWVRVQVLEWITQHPSADDRPALRQAVVSPYAQVRAAALQALAASQGPVTTDEISNVLHDPMPRVQMALIGLAKAKSIALPADVIAQLKASVDQRVSAAAAGLTNT